jgi:hypothetical protein
MAAAVVRWPLAARGTNLFWSGLGEGESGVLVFISALEGSSYEFGLVQPTQTISEVKHLLDLDTGIDLGLLSFQLWVLDDMRVMHKPKELKNETVQNVLSYSASSTKLRLLAILSFPA